MSTRNVNSDISSKGLSRKLSEVLAVGCGDLKSPFNLKEAELRLEHTTNKHSANINVLGADRTPERAKMENKWGARRPGDDSRGFLPLRRQLAFDDRQVEEGKRRMLELKDMTEFIFDNDIENVQEMFARGFQLYTPPYSHVFPTLLDSDGWIYFILSKTKDGGKVLHGLGKPNLNSLEFVTHPRVVDEFKAGEIYPAYVLPMVKLFIEKGARVDTQTLDFGDTPLHRAVRHDFTGKLTTCLLNNGANVRAVDANNETAMDVAKRIGDSKWNSKERTGGNAVVVELLYEHVKTEFRKFNRNEQKKRAISLFLQEETMKKKYHPDKLDMTAEFEDASSGIPTNK